MATSSPMNRYGSSLQRVQNSASQPSQVDTLNQNRGQGPGSAAFKTRQAASPDSLAISQRPATKSGRSSMDPTRLAEQAFRRTRDPMQRLQLGMIRSNLMGPQEDELDTLAAQSQGVGAPPPPTTGVPPPPTTGTATQSTYLGDSSSAGKNVATNSFMGSQNPAIFGFQKPRNPMFGRGLGVLRPQNQTR